MSGSSHRTGQLAQGLELGHQCPPWATNAPPNLGHEPHPPTQGHQCPPWATHSCSPSPRFPAEKGCTAQRMSTHPKAEARTPLLLPHSSISPHRAQQIHSGISHFSIQQAGDAGCSDPQHTGTCRSHSILFSAAPFQREGKDGFSAQENILPLRNSSQV